MGRHEDETYGLARLARTAAKHYRDTETGATKQEMPAPALSRVVCRECNAVHRFPAPGLPITCVCRQAKTLRNGVACGRCPNRRRTRPAARRPGSTECDSSY